MIGKTLAHYEITAKLGVGGMGEVYRARDKKLDRDVALKLLPQAVAADPERVARFQREARTLASLNHPNIGAIYGLEEAEEHRFLVIELVAGEDLAVRIQQGALRLEEALDVARQIANGLEQAHELGIVHRDLKPANIKVTPDGKVKILDFGLARAYQGQGVDEGSQLQSPTITAAMTQMGVILGTAAYMSPEQAKGRTVDRRADVWSFGVILWEMLTGKRLFEGEDVSDTLAAVLREAPPWDSLPAQTPKPVRRLLERCLERDPHQRLRDIGEARVQLEQWAGDPESLVDHAPVLDQSPRRRGVTSYLPWVVAGVAVATAVWVSLRGGDSSTGSASSMQLELHLQDEDSLRGSIGTNILLSPDNLHFAYLTEKGIHVRRLDSRATNLLSGTAGATVFTFSPDGQWLAFAVPGKLLRVSVTGGAPIEIGTASDSRGISWVNDATLVVSPGYVEPLYAVSLHDGSTKKITELDMSRHERSHRSPFRLPDGNSVLYLCQFVGQQYDEGEIRILNLADGTSKTVHRGGASPRYTSTGHLLFVRDKSVFAVPLDLAKQRTSGLALPVISDVMALVDDQENDDGSAQFDVSQSGMLVYRVGSATVTRRRVGRLDFASGTFTALSELQEYSYPVLSPDGRQLAVNRGAGLEMDIYVFDLERGVESGFTSSQGSDRLGCWSPDSRTLYWTRQVIGEASYVTVSRPADGSQSEKQLFRRNSMTFPDAVTPDGRTLLATVWSDADEWDIVQYSLVEGGASPEVLVGGKGQQNWARLSPDGRWMAYGSNEAGKSEVFVRRFPDTGASWRIAGIDNPGSWEWAQDGAGLLVRTPVGIYRVPLEIREESLSVGRAVLLLAEGFYFAFADLSAAMVPDGRTAYLMQNEASAEGGAEPATVLVTQWFDTLQRLGSTKR